MIDKTICSTKIKTYTHPTIHLSNMNSKDRARPHETTIKINKRKLPYLRKTTMQTKRVNQCVMRTQPTNTRTQTLFTINKVFNNFH